MATIHKLKKEGSTIYPATITDAIVHQDTGAILTQMINDYNVTQLYPTSGLSGGSTYDLARAVEVLSSHLTTAEKRVGTKLSFTDSVTGKVKEYIFQGDTFSSISGWVPSVTIEDLNTAFADSVHISSQDLSEREKQIARSNIGAPSVNETQIIMSQLIDLRTRDNYRTRDLGYTGETMGTGEVICATPDIAGDSGTSWVVFRYGNVSSPNSAYLRQTHEELTTIQQLYFNEKNVSKRTITFTDSTKSQVQSVGPWSTVTSLYGVQVTPTGISLRLMNPMLYNNGGLYALNLPAATTGLSGMMSAADKSKLDGIVPDNMTNITWSELKALRDSGELVPGQYYRIIDYVTTTVQAETQSAGHPFDIILQADSTDILSEDALAIKHNGDDYFADSKLEAWELKYCIDNDTERFAWADSTNGKGVIYWMKDEFDNECPYDFKNIQFARYLITNMPTVPSLAITYSGLMVVTSGSVLYPSGASIDLYSKVYRYTFDSDGSDHSLSLLTPRPYGCYENIIAPYKAVGDKRQFLNNITFANTNNVISNQCHSNKFGSNCHSMTFGNDCYDNTFGNNCITNTFGAKCSSNTFGINCNSNTFGNYCQCNTFSRYCTSNTFGAECSSNTFGSSCSSNILTRCVFIILGDYCNYNTFGVDCNSSTFSRYCTSNTFGNSCSYNTFGDNCSSITFGNSCSYNTFGNNCNYNTFGIGCTNNTFENWVENIRLDSDASNQTLFATDEIYQKKDNIYYPLSHPDLSTQPSILPQRFGNLNMYEVLSRVEDISYNYLGELEYEADSDTHLNVGLGDSGVKIKLEEDEEFNNHQVSMVGIATFDIVKPDSITSVLNGMCSYDDVTYICYLRQILVNKQGKYLFWIDDGNKDHVSYILPNVINFNTISSSFTVIDRNTCTVGKVIEFTGNWHTDEHAIINLNNLPYKSLKDLEPSARPILTSAFNDTNCEPVKIGKEDNGDWSIKQELDFTPDFVLCQYYKEDHGGYYYQYSYGGGGSVVVRDSVKDQEIAADYSNLPQSKRYLALTNTSNENASAELSNLYGTLFMSKNLADWELYSNTNTVAPGETLYLSGVLRQPGDIRIKMNKSYDVSGNPMSMYQLYYFDAKQMGQNMFASMFSSSTTLINADDLSLPATILADGCYYQMFSGCKSLTTAPELPATTLADGCYNNMFNGCTSLATAPTLPATTLVDSCYSSMFWGCTSLATAPTLPATTLASNCYNSMFWGCKSLATAPTLPATTLANYCYNSMFSGCKSLTTAPELPATTLADGCYNNMFNGCTSLATAPTLPATTLVDSCYNGMFNGCRSLNYIKAMFTTTPGSRYTSDWVNGVSSSGTFVKNSAATWDVTGTNGVPEGWTVETASE